MNFPHLRLSGRGKYLVEGNRFQDCLKAVHGMDLADYWFESGRISDMTILGNEIVNGGGFAFGLSGWDEGDPAAPKIHGRILIENNTFKSLKGESVSAAGVRELIVRDPSAVNEPAFNEACYKAFGEDIRMFGSVVSQKPDESMCGGGDLHGCTGL